MGYETILMMSAVNFSAKNRFWQYRTCGVSRRNYWEPVR